MGTEPDLDSADRETLLAVIAELRATIAEQQAIISKLQRRLIDLEGRASSRPRGMPGNRAAPSRKQPEKAQPRNKRERGYSRKKASSKYFCFNLVIEGLLISRVPRAR